MPNISKNIQPFIPLLYAVWADEVLSPSESSIILSKIDQMDELSVEEKEELKSYCNPLEMPSSVTFEQWRQFIQSNERHQLSDSRAVEQLAQLLQINYNDLPLSLKNGGQPASSTNDLTNNLTGLLNGDDNHIINKTKTLLQDPVFSFKTLRTKEEYRAQVLVWMKFLAEQGLGALSYPKEYGGENDIKSYAAVFETLGFHDLSLTIKFGVQFGLFGGSVLQLGTKKHHDKYLTAIGKAELLGCFAMTESNHGSNVKGLETTATYDNDTDQLIIHTPHELAGKEYIGNALDSKMASVFAQLIVNGENQGVHAILVPLRDEQHQLLPGVRVEDNDYKMGLNGVDNGKIWFNQVPVPVDNLLNRFGSIEAGKYVSSIESKNKRFFTMLGTLVGGRVCVPRAGLSAAKSSLKIAIKYAHKRKQFGPEDGSEITIINYPTHQKRLMPLLAKTYCLDFALQALTKRFANHEQEEDMRAIESMAAGLKAYATWHTTKTIQICREACGGKGYLAENRFTDLKADSDIFTTFEGDNTVLLLLVAKEVLRQFRTEFGKGSLMDLLKFGKDELMTKIVEKNPIITRKTDRAHLRDINFQVDAFSYRERAMTLALVKKLRSLKKKALSDHDIYLKCQNQFVSLASANIEKVVITNMATVIEKENDVETKKILSLITSQYALQVIEKHLAWYLMDGYIESNKAKSIKKETEILCNQISNYSNQLVDAFDIPESLVSAPISRL
ncbi:MAG: acyl-CoA dehydrogenase [Chitinophagales bacterium]